MTRTVPSHTCEECEATVATHRWAKIRASGDGWYFQRNGKSWCPKHRPVWAGAKPVPNSEQ